mmetsp:Transcript_86964/g.130377  ORF Transcript_86964/g.130377 Transcript_86964/m.130377 type:complete len:218 (+) Transcript_86964:257-910(+)
MQSGATSLSHGLAMLHRSHAPLQGVLFNRVDALLVACHRVLHATNDPTVVDNRVSSSLFHSSIMLLDTDEGVGNIFLILLLVSFLQGRIDVGNPRRGGGVGRAQLRLDSRSRPTLCRSLLSLDLGEVCLARRDPCLQMLPLALLVRAEASGTSEGSQTSLVFRDGGQQCGLPLFVCHEDGLWCCIGGDADQNDRSNGCGSQGRDGQRHEPSPRLHGR